MESNSAEQAIRNRATALSFGPFQYDFVRSELRDGSGRVRVGSRALQLLEVLLESPGRLYDREELVSRVWPRTVVEETSLRVHMSALRRALGDGQNGARYITNVPGRGYAFVGEVLPLASAPSSEPAPLVDLPVTAHRLPSRLTQYIGRDADIAQISGLLSRERLVSVVGPGGMGKTTIALAVAEQQSAQHEQGAFFVDLSLLADPKLVVVAVSQACGLDAARDEPWSALETALREQHVLMVLDNCEHMIDAAAALADRLLRSCRHLRILATSREALETETEWVFRLPPLGLPAPGQQLTIEATMVYPAIELFVARAQAGCHVFELTSANVSAVRQLCEVLEGIPLAIELAAARVSTLGAQGLLNRLESAFELLTRGRRTAMSRHQTLHALLNWSYELLSDTEQRVLQRLSVFRGSFDLDGAVAVASCADLNESDAVEAVLSLCAKSLVILESVNSSTPQHRLLYVTRLFAERMLAVTPNAWQVRRHHAAFVLALTAKANKAHAALPRSQRDPVLSSTVADLRAAIGWALIEENDLQLGIEIVAESVLRWLTVGFIEEYKVYMTVAIDKAERAGVQKAQLEARLQLMNTIISGQALSDSDVYLRGATVDRRLADRFECAADKIEALAALCVSSFGRGDFPQVLHICDEVRELARGELEPLSLAVADRFSMLALHELGHHDAAEPLANRLMDLNVDALEARFLSDLPVRLSARMRLARIRWLRGEFQIAWKLAQELIVRDEDAHIYAKWHPLALVAIPIAIWKGEWATAARWTQELLDQTTRGNDPYWKSFPTLFRCLLDGAPLRPGSAEAEMLAKNVLLSDLFVVLQSEARSPNALERVRAGKVGWGAPEVLRVAALRGLDSHDKESRASCVADLGEALAIAEEQGARFWSLRIAVSLCEVTQWGSVENAKARDFLRRLLCALDDGSAQPDLHQARRLMAM